MPDKTIIHPVSPTSEPPRTQSPNRSNFSNHSNLTISPTPLDPALYLVATPIGNLRDITLRALDILAGADLVLAEDTRRARTLLSAYDLRPDLSAYHDHNVAKKLPSVLKSISKGKSVALISDAGTPLVNDPGYKLARACIHDGLPVFAAPGASAVLAGLLSSGLAPDRFMFAGFLPPKTVARCAALREVVAVPATLIYFETAKRIEKSLNDVLAVLGDRQIAVARELTKKFEEILRGSVREVLAQITQAPLRGEIVLIIAPPGADTKWTQADIRDALLPLIKTQGVKRAASEVAQKSGHKKRDVYAIAQKLKDA